MSTSHASDISHGPTFVLKAINKALKQFINVFPEWILVDNLSYFSAQFLNTMASSFSYCVVISTRLHAIVIAHLVSVLADKLSTIFGKHVSPGLDTVDSDSLCHIVPVQAHLRNHVLVIQVPHVLLVLGHIVERPGTLGGSVPNLAPVVLQPLGDEWNQLFTEIFEPLLVKFLLTFLEDQDRCFEDGVDNMIGNFPHKSVDVVTRSHNHIKNRLQFKLVKISAYSLNDLLDDSNGCLQRLPSLSVVHCLSTVGVSDLRLESR